MFIRYLVQSKNAIMTDISILIYSYSNKEEESQAHFRLWSSNLWPCVTSMLHSANLTYMITTFTFYFKIFLSYWEALSGLYLHTSISHNNSGSYVFISMFYRQGN